MKNDISIDYNQITIIKTKTGFLIEVHEPREGYMAAERHSLTTSFDLQQKIQAWSDSLGQKEVE